MTTQGVKRKLRAILNADVQEYSRLMSQDEVGTIRTLNSYKKVMSSLIEQYSGRVVDAPGDNLLAELGSVIDAVTCAVEIQQKLAERNAELPDNRKMEFRIGINLGDVIEEDGRIYGDGVNIAARLEEMAEAGGICISGTVYDQIENKLDLQYEYLGKQTVKNITKPIRVYRICRKNVSAPDVTKAIKFPEKPSIAVLPFVNISGDPDQEYFSDGITEDLITDLSKLSGLFVIARNSAFTYKGKSVKVQEVSKDLGVLYVLEGGVRKAAERVRITAQLVDATTGRHLWAERYDRDLEDIFKVQDEVTQKIVNALAIRLTRNEEDRLARRYTDNLEAYDYTLRGLDYYFRFTKEAYGPALKMFEKAIELDSAYALAYSWLGLTHLHGWTQGWNRDPQEVDLAFKLAQKAITLDDTLSEAHRILGDIYLYKKMHDRAIAEREMAIALDPNNADGLAGLGEVLIYDGKIDEGIAFVKKAIRLNPHHHAWYFWILGSAFGLQGQYKEAEEILKRALIRNPDFFIVHLSLALTYAETGRLKEARAAVEESLKINPDLSLELIREMAPFKDQEIVERVIEVLQNAGLK
jgi:adenylate cyclase